MLKFLRKYQLIILAIGGTLLMVVFLLEPVITSFNRSQMNRTVARYADGTKVSSVDFDRARIELELVKRVAPVVFLPVAEMGLGLEIEGDSDERVHHWIMLSRMAEEAGVIGGVEDGRLLIERELGFEAVLMQQQGFSAVMQGLIQPQELQQLVADRIAARRGQLTAEVRAAAGTLRVRNEDEMWRLLAKFTGAFRLAEMYREMPAFSPQAARAGVKDMADTVAVDAALIPGSLLAGQVPEPAEEQLQAFFEPRAGLSPTDAPDGIGYTQPARIKIGWLVLDRQQILQSVPVDRVELRKMWELDSQKPEAERLYPGDFASERPNIEQAFRVTKADQIMVEADRVIRAEVLRTTRTLTRDGDRLTLPENWAQTRPSLETVAQSLVAGLAAENITLAMPTVVLRDDAWLNADQVAALPGVGQAGYRVGSRVVMVQQVPDLITAEGMLTDLRLQVGVPQVEPAAQDGMGNRYYLIITDHRVAGPAQSIDDAGRAKVIEDYKSLEGYKILAGMTETMTAAALSENGVRAAIDAALASVTDPAVARPGVYPNIRVGRNRIDPGPLARNADPRINAQEFRDAVIAAADGLDPLATPESLTTNPRAAVVPMPKTRAVGIARLIAPRPLTSEQFQTALNQSLVNLTFQTMSLNKEGVTNPFSLDSLKSRYGLVSVGNREEPDA